MATFVKLKLKRGTRWQAIVRKHGTKPLKKTFDIKAQAERWAREVEGDAEWTRALGTPGARLTFCELAKQYREADLGRSSRVQFWVDAIGELKLADIQRHHIQEALDEYAAGKSEVFVGRGKTRPRASGKMRGPAARNRVRSQAASIFRWAKDRGLFTGNPVAEVPALAEPKGRDRWLTEDEANRLLESARKVARTDDPLVESEWKKLPLLVMMALATGARASELTEKVRWECIDWRARTVPIEDTKNTDSRVLVLPAPVIEELLKFRPRADGESKGKGLVFGRPYDPKKPISPRNDPNKPFNVRKQWVAAVKDAGLENFRFHDCRHTAASWLVSAGVPLYNVGQVLGHRSPQSTARYAHLSIDAKKEAVDRVMGERLRVTHTSDAS